MFTNLNFINNTKEDFINQKQGKKVVIYGLCSNFPEIIDFLSIHDDIAYFVDDHQHKWNTTISYKQKNYKLLPPEYLLQEDIGLTLVLILVPAGMKIKSFLEEKGFYNNYFFAPTIIYPSFSYYNCDTDKRILNENLENIETVISKLSDEKSRYIYRNIVNKKLICSNKYYDLAQMNQYFCEDIFTFTDNETYVDAGVYDGRTIFEFVKKVNNKFEKIYGFEPDAINYANFLKEFNINKVEIFPYGLYEDNLTLSFNGGQSSSSHISDVGDTTIDVRKMDDLIKERITFLKMDIEGSEMNALRGATTLITQYKPKLAISMYHKLEDLWQIPLFVKKLVPEYKLYIRHHSLTYAETVLYAYL